MPRRLHGCTEWDMQAYVHEAAHAVAFKRGGIKVNKIKVFHTIFGNEARGWVQPGRIENEKQLRASLVAAVAGWRAQALCLHRYFDYPRSKALRATRKHTEGDFEIFREDAPLVGMSESKACDKADALVKSQWREIERIADKLAHNGSLGAFWDW